MKLTFLGTSSGVPTKQRNVTALALSPENTKRWYLVDCGEATQHRLLHTPMSLHHLEAVMITHMHGDHCYGLPGLLASAATYGRTEALTIIGPAPLKDYLDAVCRHTSLTLPYVLNFHSVEAMGQSTATPDFAISRVPMSHRVPSFAYAFKEINRSAKLDTEKLQSDGIAPGPAWGRLQQGEDVVLEDGHRLAASNYTLPGKPRQIIVGGDNDNPSLLKESAVTADVLIHEATYTADVAAHVGPGPQHSSARSVAEFAEKMNVPNLILTHFSQRYHNADGTGLAGVQDEARQYYRGNLFLASDLDVYQLNTEGLVVKSGPV